jgi:hypothetical protein
MNQDLAPTCPTNEIWLTHPRADSVAGWVAKYSWLAAPIGLLFLLGLIRRDLKVPLLLAFVNLAGGAVLATAMVGVQRVSGLLYAGSAELLMAYAVGIAVAGGGVSFLVGFLNQRVRLALAAAASLTQSLVTAVEPALMTTWQGKRSCPGPFSAWSLWRDLPWGQCWPSLALRGDQARHS